MLSRGELVALSSKIESDWVERNISANNIDKFYEAICAFSKLLPQPQNKWLLDY